ncbi:uncharacterized protein DS421_15g497530 [Arachis hypogaea]|nr:uncharacterized protein DS421_15g497530 [Arachis hypogaea]
MKREKEGTAAPVGPSAAVAAVHATREEEPSRLNEEQRVRGSREVAAVSPLELLAASLAIGSYRRSCRCSVLAIFLSAVCSELLLLRYVVTECVPLLHAAFVAAGVAATAFLAVPHGSEKWTGPASLTGLIANRRCKRSGPPPKTAGEKSGRKLVNRPKTGELAENQPVGPDCIPSPVAVHRRRDSQVVSTTAVAWSLPHSFISVSLHSSSVPPPSPGPQHRTAASSSSSSLASRTQLKKLEGLDEETLMPQKTPPPSTYPCYLKVEKGQELIKGMKRKACKVKKLWEIKDLGCIHRRARAADAHAWNVKSHGGAYTYMTRTHGKQKCQATRTRDPRVRVNVHT